VKINFTVEIDDKKFDISKIKKIYVVSTPDGLYEEKDIELSIDGNKYPYSKAYKLAAIINALKKFLKEA